MPSPVLAFDHWPVAGWYSSANVGDPPVTSTSPSGSKVPVLVPAALIMLPVAVNFPVAGFSSTINSDSKTYGAIGAVFGILTWFIAIGAVIILGAVAGAAWQDRKSTRPARQ